MSRDCSKNRPSTFTELSFPITQEIDNKIKNKVLLLRRKYKMRLAERAKTLSSADAPAPRPAAYNKVDRDQVNYLDYYDEPRTLRDPSALQIGIEKLEEKDEEMAFHIYLLMRKRKTIFKVEEVRRKLKTHPKRTRLYDSEARTRHRYVPERRPIDKRRQKLESSEAGELYEEEVREDEVREEQPKEEKEEAKEEVVKEEQPFERQMEPEGAVQVAEELIAHPQELQPVQVLQITRKEEEMMIPKIDVIEEEPHKQEAHPDTPPDEEPAVVERDRISEVESKSQVSESRRNRSSQPGRESAELGDYLLEVGRESKGESREGRE